MRGHPSETGGFLENNRRITQLSQNLRTNATKEENTLWYQYLRRYPVQFRRQCPFGSYIVDFYCAAAKLVIEVDGTQHFEQTGISLDQERDAYLRGLELRILRFSNREIDLYFDRVCEAIRLHIENCR